MIANPKLFRIINGEPHIGGAGILLLAAFAANDSSPETPRTTRERGRDTVEALLRAARAGGFEGSEILETLLATDRSAERTIDLAIEAVDCIGGPEQFAAALATTGFYPEGR
jgi:hypothetical protein